MNQVGISSRLLLQIIALVFLFVSSIGLGIFLNYFFFNMTLAVAFGAIYIFNQNNINQKKQELKEFKFAVERFYASINTINTVNEQLDLMISYYAKQFSQINQALSNILPAEKSIVRAVPASNKYSSYDLEWLELLRIYNERAFEYPSKAVLLKLSPQSIHQHCNRLEEYRVKMSFFADSLAKKGEQDLIKYEKLVSNAVESTKFTK